MTNDWRWLLLVLSVMTLLASAQVVVHQDSTVSFCYCGEAGRVSVQSDLLYADEDTARYTDLTRRIGMQRDSDGCFRVRTGKVSPEMYTYCFRVDGKRTPDPSNNDTVWQKKHKWNVLNIGGSPQAALYDQPEHCGRLIRTTWYSRSEKIHRRVNIYLPAAYNAEKPCPVIYLIHGLNGYEGSWMERGRAVRIMENLAAKGECRPMILVMPDVNVVVKENQPSHYSLWHNIMHYPRLCRNHDIERGLADLVMYVDSAYCVSGTRFIAGISDGARIAANTANLLTGGFEAVGMFSPVVRKEQLPADSTLVFVYTGRRDMFHINAERFCRRMDKCGLPYKYTETTGGHTWRNWRIYLADYLRRISSAY